MQQQLLLSLDQIMSQLPYQYRNKPQLRADIAELFRSCQTLEPHQGSFSAGGRSVQLFYLSGVVPINYQGNVYNIPVTIYFDPPYPEKAPRCFVTPTETMEIKPGHQHVDQNGMVYLPYLNQWRMGQSRLPELIRALGECFSSAPPVHAKPARSSQTSAVGVVAQGASALLGAGANMVGGWLSGSSSQQSPAQAQPVQATPVQATPVQATPVNVVSPKERNVQELTRRAQARLPQLMQPVVSEANEELEKQGKLQEHERQIDSEMQALRDEAEILQRHLQALDAQEHQLTQFVAQQGDEEPDINAVVEPSDALGRQLLDLIAEEKANGDLLVALDEAILERKISTEVFLREIRDVSRKQFLCKALKEKVIQAKVAQDLSGAALLPSSSAPLATPAASVQPPRAVASAQTARVPEVAASPSGGYAAQAAPQATPTPAPVPAKAAAVPAPQARASKAPARVAMPG